MSVFGCDVDGCEYEGSWRGLSNHINHAPNHDVVDKSDYIRREVKRVIEDEMNGDVPTQDDFNEFSHISANTVWEINGGLSKTVEELGYDSGSLNKEKLLHDIERVSEECCSGEAPKYEEMEKHTQYHARAYFEYFESYSKAVEKCGFSPHEKHNISREELIEEIRGLVEEIGSIPTTSDMDEIGKFSYGTYINRFGSWNIALGKAGLDSKAERESSVDLSYKYHTGDYQKKRERALERAEGECEHPDCCKNESDNGYSLDCHHIVPKRLTDNPRVHDMDNLLILCREHHIDIEPPKKWFSQRIAAC